MILRRWLRSMVFRPIRCHFKNKIVLASISTSFRKLQAIEPFSKIPVKRGSLIRGVLPEIRRDGRPLCYKLEEWQREYGKTFRVHFGYGKYLLRVSTPEGVETVQRNEGKYPNRGNVLSGIAAASKEADTPNYLLREGEEWKEARSQLNPGIVLRRLNAIAYRLDEVADTFIEIMLENQDKNGYVPDIRSFMGPWSTEAMSRFVFPQNIMIQKFNSKEAEKMAKALGNTVEASVKVSTSPEWYLRTFRRRQFKSLTNDMKIVKEICTSWLDEDLLDVESVEEDCLLKQWKLQQFSRKMIISAVVAFLSAGVDSTSNQMSFLLYLVAKYPEVQKKLHDEVFSVIGQNGKVDGESLQALPYLKACFKETVRIFPIAPAYVRVMPEETVIDGYSIQKKTSVLLDTWSIGRNPEYFEDPLSFKPERWLQNESSSSFKPFTLNVFGNGPRQCVGRRIAELEMYSLLAKIAQRMRMTLDTDSDNVEAVGSASLKPNKPLRIKFTPW